MYQSLERTTTPASAVTLAELKEYLRCDHTAEDATLTEMLAEAVNDCEKVAGLQLCTATLVWQFSAWPTEELRLPVNPVQSITSIQYRDIAGDLQTLDAETYSLDACRKAAVVCLAPNASWPSIQTREDAIVVTFVAGYGAATAVPAGLRQWIKRRVAMAYQDREALEIPDAVYRLLDRFRPMDGR